MQLCLIYRIKLFYFVLVYFSSNLNFSFKFQNGARPIHYAAIQNKIETLFKLEELGADLCAKDKVNIHFILYKEDLI